MSSTGILIHFRALLLSSPDAQERNGSTTRGADEAQVRGDESKGGKRKVFSLLHTQVTRAIELAHLTKEEVDKNHLADHDVITHPGCE